MLDAPDLIPDAPWTAPLRALPDAAATAELVRHLRSLSGPRPSQKWRRTCTALADAAGARGALAEVVRVLAEDDPMCSEYYGYSDGWEDDDDDCYHHHFLVHDRHGDLARGIVWAAALTGGASAVPHIAALALRAPGGGRTACGEPPEGHKPRKRVWRVLARAVIPDSAPVSGPIPLMENLKVAGAAINALGAVDDPAGLEALTGLRGRIKHRGLRKQVDAALQTAGERLGLTPEQVVERGIPAHGLGPDGSIERKLGAYSARLAIEDATTVRITFTGPDGRTTRTAPAAVKDGSADELADLKALAKEVRGTLGNERRRIEGLMSAGRTWTFAEWAAHYRDHPVTGAVVRALIWEFQGTDGVWRASMDVAAAESAHVRLWHPVRATIEEVRAWREQVAEQGRRQPFKQAFREIYLLTPAEEETETYSNRYAAHIVRYHRLYALLKERGWQTNYLGPYDGGVDGEARREFADGRWRACLFHDMVSVADYTAEHASTDQVRFERRDGRHWREAPLAEVPPAVFSEAMRDVDLFVAVTSIAADPEWADRGDDRYRAYWREQAFGELTASAEVRRAALERVLPRTKIADRCTLDGRFLTVRGDLRTYKIHLGSANILMEPDGAYLCIVQGRSGGRVFLPFEDERLSLILSKAFLLAADTEITDPSIRRQITR